MLKKRIVVFATTLALCLPCLASAVPLSWTPSPGILTTLTRLWDLLPGAHPRTAARPAHDLRKNGAGMDPTGGTPPPPPTSQSTTPDSTTGS